MKFIFKSIAFLFFFSIFLFISYLNLGNFLDATSKPAKTDLLVCLGGGDYKIRIEKTLELYSRGFLNSNTIVLTGYVNSQYEVKKGVVEDKRLTVIKDSDYEALHVELHKNLKNTAAEIKYVKEYMLSHDLKSVTFITEPPHSRRILMFSKIISVDGDENLSVSVVGANYKNWDADKYYEDKYAKNYAFSETIKIVYGIFMYGILDKVGLREWFEVKFTDDLNDSKKMLNQGMNFIS